MWQYIPTEELYHYGVQGQKWGRRLYQNPDGSLTPLGRMRARQLAKKYANVTGKELVVKKRSVEAKEKPREKTIKEMSDYELQQKINRINLENTYLKAMASQVPKEKVSAGKRFVQSVGRNVIAPAFKDAGRDILTNLLKRVGNNAVYEATKKQPTAYDKKKEKANNLKLDAEISKYKKQIKQNTEAAIKKTKDQQIQETRQNLWKQISDNKGNQEAINAAMKQFEIEYNNLTRSNNYNKKNKR